MRWLPYLHPVAMVFVVALGLLVLREGLGLRRARLAQRPRDASRHRRLARVLVVLVAPGYASGLASMAWLRDEALAESVHFPLATGALAGLLTAGALGLLLERRVRAQLRTAHMVSGAVGLLLALAAAVAGIAILP